MFDWKLEVLCHSSIRIQKHKTIYVDPFRIDKNYGDADIILVTHSHYDHFSEEDIAKVKKDNTVIVVTKDLYEKVLSLGFAKENVMVAEPNEEYFVGDIKIETVPAYNINKEFHPKENSWVGYILEIEGTRIFIAGDTDMNDENRKVKCDIAFVPVGGTYTMSFGESASLINEISPQIAIPTHYGEIVGTKQDALKFEKLINPEIECRILIK